MLCQNGCGQEAIHKQKNGKFVCNIDHRKCPINRIKYSLPGKNNPMYGQKHSDKTKILIGQKSSKRLCSEETREKLRRRSVGSRNPNFGKSRPHTEEAKIKISNALKGKPLSEKNKLGISRALKGRIFTETWKNKLSKKAIDRIKKYGLVFHHPSKEQIKLFKIIQELYPNCILEYWVKDVNRSIDIAILEHKIAIEYDGSYWHQDKEADNKRQKEIESLGWKFIRFIDYIPSKQELEKLINENVEC